MKSFEQMILEIRTALATNSLVNWGTLKQEIDAHEDKDTLQAYLVSHKKSTLLEAGDRHVVNLEGVDFAMRWIPAGSFLMGSSDYNIMAHDDEKPQHEVTLTRGFWMMETPVTQEQFISVAYIDPSFHFSSNNRFPVESVNWYEAADFANRLSALEGCSSCFVKKDEAMLGIGNGRSDYLESNGWRLPTEAEWEYACRAETTTARYYGDLDKIAWYIDNSYDKMHSVGQKQPNAWGLYDMLGNVSEWCYDCLEWFKADSITNPIIAPSNRYEQRVVRGGSYKSSYKSVRSAYRSHELPKLSKFDIGFRLVRGL